VDSTEIQEIQDTYLREKLGKVFTSLTKAGNIVEVDTERLAVNGRNVYRYKLLREFAAVRTERQKSAGL
jgi:hypothetical protein